MRKASNFAALSAAPFGWGVGLLALLLVGMMVGVENVRAADPTSAKAAPPAFFVQDPTDSLCLAGEEFKRCSIDTLFYVLGEPGAFAQNENAVCLRQRFGPARQRPAASRVAPTGHDMT
jgi:hypothetical protein